MLRNADAAASGRCRRPAEVRFVPPHAVQHYRELARHGHERLLHASPFGNSQTPCLKRVLVAARARQQHESRLIKCSAHHGVATPRDASNAHRLARLVKPRRQAVTCTYTLRSPEPGRVIHAGAIGQRDDWSDARRGHQPTAHRIGAHLVEQYLVQLGQLRPQCRASPSSGSTTAATKGRSSKRSRTRGSKPTAPTTPTFRPKLRNCPRRSLSMS